MLPARALALSLIVFFLTAALTCATETPTPAADQSQDGPHGIEFEMGTWQIHLKRFLHPRTVSNQWQEFDGTSYTRKVWDGRANLEEFETDGAAGNIEGLTLRRYRPDSHQWWICWASKKDPFLGAPTIGGF